MLEFLRGLVYDKENDSWNIIMLGLIVLAVILVVVLARWMLGEVCNDLAAFWTDLMAELENWLNPAKKIDELLRPV